MKGKKNTIQIPLNRGYKVISTSPSRTAKPHTPGIKPSKQARVSANRFDDELRAVGTDVQRTLLNAQHELKLARQIRAEAERYFKETETKARSQAQRLILKTRLETEKELAELKLRTTQEIQKLLVDIRMVRIMALEELEVQRKITDAARIKHLSITSRKSFEKKMKKVAETVCPAT